ISASNCSYSSQVTSGIVTMAPSGRFSTVAKKLEIFLTGCARIEIPLAYPSIRNDHTPPRENGRGTNSRIASRRVFHSKSKQSGLERQEPRIFTDATDQRGLSVTIRSIRENPRFLLSQCRLRRLKSNSRHCAIAIQHDTFLLPERQIGQMRPGHSVV